LAEWLCLSDHDQPIAICCSVHRRIADRVRNGFLAECQSRIDEPCKKFKNGLIDILSNQIR